MGICELRIADLLQCVCGITVGDTLQLHVAPRFAFFSLDNMFDHFKDIFDFNPEACVRMYENRIVLCGNRILIRI